MKQAVIAPSMLYLLYPLNGSVEGYSKEQFVEDLVNEVRDYVLLGADESGILKRTSARKTSAAALRQARRGAEVTLPKVCAHKRKPRRHGSSMARNHG